MDPQAVPVLRRASSFAPGQYTYQYRPLRRLPAHDRLNIFRRLDGVEFTLRGFEALRFALRTACVLHGSFLALDYCASVFDVKIVYPGLTVTWRAESW